MSSSKIKSTKTFSTIDAQLEEVKHIVERHLSKKRKKSVKRHSKIYDIVKEFIIEKQLILYGGFALNEVLPQKYKFYDEHELPDFDCFSMNALEDAKELANKLCNEHQKFVQVKEGFHKGTFKVFVDFDVILDVTQVTTKFFKYMLKTARTNKYINISDDRFLIVSIDFMRWSIHKELSRPEGSLFRWEKVYKRYITFIRHFVKTDDTKKDLIENKLESNSISDPVLIELLESLRDIIKTHNYPLIGNFAIGLHLNKQVEKLKCCKLADWLSTFDMLSSSPQRLVKELNSKLPLPSGYKYILEERNQNSLYFVEVMPYRIRCFVECPDESIFSLYTVYSTHENCYSVKDIKGYRVGSIDTILCMLFGYYMVYDMFEPKNRHKTQLIKYYINILEKKALKIPIKERLLTSCYGDEKSLKDFKRENWDKQRFVYKSQLCSKK
jgi:hypothetical protein